MWNSQPTLTSSSQLPSSTVLELISKILRFNRIQKYISSKSNISQISLSLMKQLVGTQSDIQSDIQDILLSTAQHSSHLCNTLLDNILPSNGNLTSSYAQFSGRLCGISVEGVTPTHYLNKFYDYLLQHILSDSFNSQVIPFLGALSFAINQHLYSGASLSLQIPSELTPTLFNLALSSLEDSLMEDHLLRLLSSLIQIDDNNLKQLLDLKGLELENHRVLQFIGTLSISSSSAARQLEKSNLLQQIVQLLLKELEIIRRQETTSEVFFGNLLEFFADIAHDDGLKDWIGENLLGSLLTLCETSNYKSSVLHGVLEVCKSLLHPKNQSLLAERFGKWVRTQSSLSPLILSLMAELFSIPDLLVLCLHPLHPEQSEDLLIDGLMATKQEPLLADTKFCSSFIQIDENMQTITSGGSGS